MTISTRHPVVNTICSRNLHRHGVSFILGDTFIGQVYADALWSNRPEKKQGPG